MKLEAGFDIELLSVQPGRVFWIRANAASLDLIEALAFRIRGFRV